MALTLDEELRRLDALRWAMGWSEDEYRRRIDQTKQRIANATRPGQAEPQVSHGTGSQTGAALETPFVAPFRFVDIADAVALPPASVHAALNGRDGNCSLHSDPLPDGYGGEIEVTFAVETPFLIGSESDSPLQDKDKDCVVPLGRTKDGRSSGRRKPASGQ